MTVKVKFDDFRRITRSRSQAAPVASYEELRAASLGLIRLVLPAEQGIRLVGVTVSSFEAPAPACAPEDQPLPLFAA